MLTDSVLALKWMLSFPFLCESVLLEDGSTRNDWVIRFFENVKNLQHLSVPMSVRFVGLHLTNVQVLSDLGPTDIQQPAGHVLSSHKVLERAGCANRHLFWCGLSVLQLVRHAHQHDAGRRGLQLFLHAREDDAVEVRLPNALMANVVGSRRDVELHRGQQLCGGETRIDVEFAIEEVGVDAFRGVRAALLTILCPPSGKFSLLDQTHTDLPNTIQNPKTHTLLRDGISTRLDLLESPLWQEQKTSDEGIQDELGALVLVLHRFSHRFRFLVRDRGEECWFSEASPRGFDTGFFRDICLSELWFSTDYLPKKRWVLRLAVPKNALGFLHAELEE